MLGEKPVADYSALVEQLAIPHRARAAFWQLRSAGPEAESEVYAGLRHRSNDVRYYCCVILDRYLSPDRVDDVIGMLGDPDARVRRAALHTLACDRCKEGECRADAAVVLPLAIGLLAHDLNLQVRAIAVEVIGQWVHTHILAERALLASRDSDPSPTVRKQAGWYAPGGTIYVRTAPKLRSKKARFRQAKRHVRAQTM